MRLKTPVLPANPMHGCSVQAGLGMLFSLNSMAAAQNFVPGSYYYRLPGGWANHHQIDPDYYQTGIQTRIWEHFFPYNGFTITPQDAPDDGYDWPLVPDYTTTRYHQTSITLRNDSYCHTIDLSPSFSAIDSATVQVSTTQSSGWNATAVAQWADPLTSEITLTLQYTNTTSTTWSFSQTVELQSTVPGLFPVDSCKKRLAYLVIEETHRERGTDFFDAILFITGWVHNAQGTTLFNYPHYLGRGLDRVDGYAKWISNLEVVSPEPTNMDLWLHC